MAVIEAVPIPGVQTSTVGNLTVRTERCGGGGRLSLQRGNARPVFLTSFRHGCYAPALSPDGQQLAYQRWDLKSRKRKERRVDLVVRSISTGRERVLVKKALLWRNVWSPDGNWLIVTGGGNLDVYDVEREKRTKLWKTKRFDKRFIHHEATSLVWSPSSTHIAARFRFTGKREKSNAAEQKFGINKLVVIEFATGAAKIYELPMREYEGPFRGEMRPAVSKI